MKTQPLPDDLSAERTSTAGGLPVAPSLESELPPTLSAAGSYLADSRTVFISALAICLGLMSALIAQVLMKLIGFVTSVSFYGRASDSFVSPAGNHLGLWVIAVPIIGGLVVGVHGSLWISSYSGTWNSGGDGTSSAQRKPDPAASHFVEACLGGDLDWNRRAVWS